jgi:hypothetical protein
MANTQQDAGRKDSIMKISDLIKVRKTKIPGSNYVVCFVGHTVSGTDKNQTITQAIDEVKHLIFLAKQHNLPPKETK